MTGRALFVFGIRTAGWMPSRSGSASRSTSSHRGRTSSDRSGALGGESTRFTVERLYRIRLCTTERDRAGSAKLSDHFPRRVFVSPVPGAVSDPSSLVDRAVLIRLNKDSEGAWLRGIGRVKERFQ